MRRVILSRKGFDSDSGGGPSPILPDARLVSLPIPSSDQDRYGSVLYENGRSIGDLMNALGYEARPDKGCHLDPDLVHLSKSRTEGWRPNLGQRGSSQTHLANRRVGVGDLFLFFGWYRPTTLVDGKLRWELGAHRDWHVIYGYLEIGDVLLADEDADLPSWLTDHPHASAWRRKSANNTIYIASERLAIDPRYAGGGTFRYEDSLRLTKSGMSRTRWNLDPGIFQDAPFSFHTEASWKGNYFQSTARGQEFVIQANEKVKGWVKSLFGRATMRSI